MKRRAPPLAAGENTGCCTQHLRARSVCCCANCCRRELRAALGGRCNARRTLRVLVAAREGCNLCFGESPACGGGAVYPAAARFRVVVQALPERIEHVPRSAEGYFLRTAAPSKARPLPNLPLNLSRGRGEARRAAARLKQRDAVRSAAATCKPRAG